MRTACPRTGPGASASPPVIRQTGPAWLTVWLPRDKIWALEGYLLKQRLWDASVPRRSSVGLLAVLARRGESTVSQVTSNSIIPEVSDPKPDGFMRLEEVVEALASGYKAYRDRDDGNTLHIVKTAGHVRFDTLGRLMREGWLREHANGGGFDLSDAGFRAYQRAYDEMGDGKLVAPILGGGQLPRCPRCQGPVRVQLMGTLVCDRCKTGVSG